MVFLDSAYLIALINERDQHREKAVEWSARVEADETPLITTEFCLMEVVDFLSGRGHRALGRAVVAELRRGTRVEVIPLSSALLDRGLELHAQRDDKTWSLTDCVSIIVMRDRGLVDVLTFDRHFVQAGMRALPLE